MDPKIFIEDYLKGKPVYPTARRILSFLFSVSITSFLFERLFFQYTLIDITDYKSLYEFFIKGFFFVPFFLYVIVHFVLHFISRLIYSSLITIKANHYQKKIIGTKLKKSKAKKIIKDLNRNTPIPFIVDIPWLYAIYQHFNEHYTIEQWNIMLANIEKAKRSNEQNFTLICKAIIAISIYIATVPYFHWGLYTLAIAVSLSFAFLLSIAYLLMEVGPLGIQKAHAEVTEYFVRQEEIQNQPVNPEQTPPNQTI